MMEDNPKPISWNEVFDKAKARLPYRSEEVIRRSDIMIEGLLRVIGQSEIDTKYILREEKNKLHPDNTPPANLFSARKDVWGGKIQLGESNMLKGYNENALIYAFAEHRYYRFIEFLELNNNASVKDFEESEKFKRNQEQIAFINWRGKHEQLEFLFHKLIDEGFIDCHNNMFKGLFFEPFVGKVKWRKSLAELSYFFEQLVNSALIGVRPNDNKLCNYFLNNQGKVFRSKAVARSRSGRFGSDKDDVKLSEIVKQTEMIT